MGDVNWMLLIELLYNTVCLNPHGNGDHPPAFLEIVVGETTDYRIAEVRNQGTYLPIIIKSLLSFEALPLKTALINSLYVNDLTTPTSLQTCILPAALSNTNIMVQSMWGTGKSTAFIVAILNRIDVAKEHPQVICISSCDELVYQNEEMAQTLIECYPFVKLFAAYKGRPFLGGQKISEHVIFGTPEAVVKLASRGAFDYRQIQIFVVHDADIIFDIPVYRQHCFSINESVTNSCQKMYFSSTHNIDLMAYLPTLVWKPTIFKSKKKFGYMLDNVYQFAVACADEQKYEAVLNVCATFNEESILIYCSTPETANFLAIKLIAAKYDVAICTNDMSPQLRASIYKRLRKQPCSVLIATDILTRGINLNQFTVVLNYDIPHSNYGYVNRVSRTGKMHSKGIVLNLITSQDAYCIRQIIEETFSLKMIDIHYTSIKHIMIAYIMIEMSE